MPAVGHGPAPGAGPVTSYADVGKRSAYLHDLHASKGFLNIDNSVLGDAACVVVQAAAALEGGAQGFTAADRALLQNVQTGLQNVQAEMSGVKLLLKVKGDNAEKRFANSMSVCGDHKLQPLLREEEGGQGVGSAPPAGIFPPTLDDAGALSNQQLNDLADFYGRPFPGNSLAERRGSLYGFILLFRR
ncbi:hypothetical protein TSOC_002139 [Tetrabaena socialis]|uniref:Uncharacterized protein n=1 Tax=Tetrabaena socialis TaxID=47790 RepID=A0A2J8AEY6_9CHLO|nr:hypothetical protein TSOC_012850 [Tetrabaena socialis]PNH11069.1 hypothetical protein TSOC_002139 [Tetrabaena socialis]|eukprot:PNH01277.1 hypothetical protein TSOC_012850 [Tetrabaena socialis]